MEGLEPTDSTSTQAAPDAGAAPTLSTAAGTDDTAKTAPAESPEREALRRLSAGEKPQDIQRDLHTRAASKGQTQPPAKPANAPTQSSPPASAKTADQPAQAESHGLGEKELNALRRAKFDLALLPHMPLSNRKAIAKGLADSQAETDRQFQAARAGGTAAPKNDQPAAQSAEPAPGTPPATNTTPAQQPAPNDTTPKSGEAAATGSMFQPWKLPDADYANLVDIGGEDFAKSYKGQLESLNAHHQQQFSQLANVLGFAVQQLETRDFRDAVGELRKQPGYENLTPEQETALRSEAELLIRTKGDLGKYNFAHAIPTAAASLFRIDTTLAAQAKLAAGVKRSLNGSPDRGGSAQPQAPAKLSDSDRYTLALKALRGGGDREAIRAAFEGKAA